MHVRIRRRPMNMVIYINGFLNIKLKLNYWGKLTLLKHKIILICYWIIFVNI